MCVCFLLQPSGKKMLLSGRFLKDETEELIRAVGGELHKLGETVLLVDVDAGENFGKQTMKFMNSMEIMVAFVSDNYGQ